MKKLLSALLAIAFFTSQAFSTPLGFSLLCVPLNQQVKSISLTNTPIYMYSSDLSAGTSGILITGGNDIKITAKEQTKRTKDTKEDSNTFVSKRSDYRFYYKTKIKGQNMKRDQIVDFENRIKEIEVDLLLPARMSKAVDEKALKEYFSILDDIASVLENSVNIDKLLAGKVVNIYNSIFTEADYVDNTQRLKEVPIEIEKYLFKIFDETIIPNNKFIEECHLKIDSFEKQLIHDSHKKIIDSNIEKQLFSLLDEIVLFFGCKSSIDRSLIGKLLRILSIISMEVSMKTTKYNDPLLLAIAGFSGNLSILMPERVSFGRNDVDSYNVFCNFSPYGFELKGKYWKTVAHYYQAMKFEGTKYEDEIRLLNTPEEAELKGKDVALPFRDDWKDIKVNIMKQAVLTKFQSNDVLRDLLLSTRYEDIAFYGLEDYFWGAGREDNGKNMLGRITAETRRVLRKQED